MKLPCCASVGTESLRHWSIWARVGSETVSLWRTAYNCGLQFIGHSELYGQDSLLQKARHNTLCYLASCNWKEKIKYQKRVFICLNFPKHEIHLISDIGFGTAEVICYSYLNAGEKKYIYFSPLYNQMSKALAKRSRVRLFKMCNKIRSQWRVSKKENPNHLLKLRSICHYTRSGSTWRQCLPKHLSWEQYGIIYQPGCTS